MKTTGLGNKLLRAEGVSTAPDSFSEFVAKAGLEFLAHTTATVAINGESFESITSRKVIELFKPLFSGQNSNKSIFTPLADRVSHSARFMLMFYV